MISANHAATSASDAGDHGDGETSPELLGTALQAAVGHPEGTRREPVLLRIQRRQRKVAGRPGLTAASSAAVAGARVSLGSALGCSGGGAGGICVLLGGHRTR